MDLKDLISAAADAAEKDAASQQSPAVDVEALKKHGLDARRHVWERHHANEYAREILAQKLAASTPEFQLAVALTEKILADELADDNVRRARALAENPSIIKD